MPKLTGFQKFALLGVIVIALNLRAPFTSVAPVLDQIMDSLNLSAATGGLVTALPLATLALFSPLAPKLAIKVGLERALATALIFVGIGVLVRSLGDVIPLMLGTVILGSGIALGNVLLPAVVKETFPHHISVVSSFYVFVMGVGATLAASLMVPISHTAPNGIHGWQFALTFNLLFPIAALVYWLPKTRAPNPTAQVDTPRSSGTNMFALMRSPIAWQVTFALGVNSFTFYAFAGWLPKILTDLGYSELQAGYIYGFLQFSTMLPGLLLMPILAKVNNHVVLISLCAGSVVLSLLGLIAAPQWAIFWVGLFGLVNCSTFIVALSFVGLRTQNSKQAALLSGMSQSVGYALAATGPSLIGTIHTQTQGWTWPLLTIAAFGVVCALFAALAARKRIID